jgi:glycogen debranching enzyme
LEELIRYNDAHYILAESTVADDHARVLKYDETFAIFDRYGDIRALGLGEQGLYHEGTRYVSYCRLRLGGEKPLLLSSSVKPDNSLFTVDMTNPDLPLDGGNLIPRGSLHIVRLIFLWRESCYQRIRVKNHAHTAISASLSLKVEADFADIFEVRGTSRLRRGRYRDTTTGTDCLLLGYEGLDGVARQTRLEFRPLPFQILPGMASFELALEPKEEVTIFFTIRCCSWATNSPSPIRVPRYLCEAASERAAAAQQEKRRQYCEIRTSNERFNDWVNRSLADLQMMTTETETGPYPDAGVPWFSTRFGRDGIITALEALWVNPQIAAGVLRFLAASQAQVNDPEHDAQPGKILHETRKGEMAALGEIPFGCYYGSVDSTPLFIVLAAAYYERTADRDTVNDLLPHVRRALEWIDTYGDIDGDGFVEYHRTSSKGLVHQGWKDSWDSVFHEDGTPASGPIALCEVQAYTYAAKLAAAKLLSVTGEREMALKLEQQAKALQEQFETAFWCEDLSTYALALDGRKRPCRVRTSNAGHVLFSGMAKPDRAIRAAKTLLDSTSFSGWGVRTVASTEALYNPMSYHNGSVWPHDNALIAVGLARYGIEEGVAQILTGLFDAAQFVEFQRLPELVCGFQRRLGESPTLYPVACSPQAWAAASVFALLQSSLGLSIAGPRGEIWFRHSRLPAFLREVHISNLQVGKASVDLSLHRYEGGVTFTVKKRGKIEVISTK